MILYSSITWSEMGQQNVQTKNFYYHNPPDNASVHNALSQLSEDRAIICAYPHAIRLNFAPKRTDNYRISLSSIKISNMFSEGHMYPLGTEICSPKNMWAFHGSRTNTETLSRLRKNRSDHGFT